MSTETELEARLLAETRTAQRQALLKKLWHLRQSLAANGNEAATTEKRSARLQDDATTAPQRLITKN